MATVTAVVKDPNGNIYTRALVIASFVGQNTTPGAGPYITGGTPSGQFQPVIPTETDSFGAFSVIIPGNDTITPTPSQWRFTVASSTTPSVGFAVLITISGASQDITAALQAASAPLPSTSFGNVTVNNLTVTGTLTAAFTNNVCNANQQPGADLGAKINACIALGSGTDILVSAAGTISTQVVFNNVNNMSLHCNGVKGAIVISDGITGNPSEPMIKVTGTSSRIKFENCGFLGNGIAGNGGNGNAITILGTGAQPQDVQVINCLFQSFAGNGKDSTGASMLAAGVYMNSVIDTKILWSVFGAGQQGVVYDGTTNHHQLYLSEFFGNLKSAIVTKGSPQHIEINGVDVEGNGTANSDNYLDFEACTFDCSFHHSWVEFNNGLAGFFANGNNGAWDIYDNIWIHGVSAGSPNASTAFAINTSGNGLQIHYHDNYNLLQGSSLFRWLQLNPSNAGAGKWVDHNIFEENATGSPTISFAVIGWGAVSTHTGPCDISYNQFGGPQNNYFAANAGIDLVNGTPTGCTLIGNHFFNTSGTITTGINIAAGSTNIIVANTTKQATVTTLITDAGTNTTCMGQGCTQTIATGNFSLTEQTPPTATAAKSMLWGDSGDHMLKYNPNNAGEQHVAQVYRLTAQYTNSTTGFTTVGTPNIAFPVNANQTYTATCHLFYQAAATGGLNIQFTGPAAPTSVTYGLDDPSAATTFNSAVATAFSTSLGQVVGTAATNFDAIVSFCLINGANAGTVTLQAKSSAAVQLQIQTGSYCVVQ